MSKTAQVSSHIVTRPCGIERKATKDGEAKNKNAFRCLCLCVYEFPLFGEGGRAGGMKEDDRKLRRKATVCAVG